MANKDTCTGRHGGIRTFSRVPTICERRSCSRSTLYREIREGRFPPLIRISPGISALADDIYAEWAADPVAWAAKNKMT